MSIKRSSDKVFPEEEPEFQVAPMIDILLVLMTFFMSITSTEVLKTQTKLQIELPVAKNSAPVGAPIPEVVINIGWDGKKGAIEIDGADSFSDPNIISDIIAKKKTNAKSFRAVIRSAETTPYSFVQQVMGACAGAQVDSIVFSVLSQEGKKNYDNRPKP